jgi:hypothetical protein
LSGSASWAIILGDFVDARLGLVFLFVDRLAFLFDGVSGAFG